MKHQSVKIGDRVPLFSLKNQHGEPVAIERFFGNPFILFFYPKDDSPGCTVEACSFRDAYSELRDLDAEVIGVSADSPASHLAFAKKFKLPFTLLSDEKNKVRNMFGVQKSLFGLIEGRVTFVVDAQGVVRHIFDAQFLVRQHVREALEHLRSRVAA